ncbi:MAG TPA: dicarboxylate/amino acid:cation symporter [Chitinophagaceae bacterium]|nr:dicarboxylate/amino acid:cation symporter [Chitinophagaceae bacterium]
MRKIALHWQIFFGLFAGIVFGYFLSDYVHYISWMGTIFLRSLKMIIIPLLLFSVMAGIMNVGNPAGLGRLGLKTITFYIGSSLAAICTGLFIVNLMKPGAGADLGFNQPVEGLAAASENFGQTLINIIPENIFRSFVNGDMLSVIFFAVLLGIFATQLSENFKNMTLKGVNAGFELMMKITHFIIRFTPLGVMAIIAVVVADNMAQEGALGSVFLRLGKYMLTVIIALSIHALITLPLALRLIGKINPIKHFKAVTTPLLTAFSTSSSSATLPLTLHSMENTAGVSNKVSSFVLPLGATINMDGTALYECVAAMFIAQAYGIDLSIWQQVILVFTALLASIGAAGIPMAGLVMISVVLSAVGLPLEGVGLIIAVDRLLDMFRTSVNVWSDTSAASIIASSEGEKLKTSF